MAPSKAAETLVESPILSGVSFLFRKSSADLRASSAADNISARRGSTSLPSSVSSTIEIGLRSSGSDEVPCGVLELSCVLAGQGRREDDHTSGAPRETSLIKHGAPLAGRISVAAAIDPRIMSKRLRSLRNHPNERDPKQQDPVCNLIWTYCHRTPPQCRPQAALPLLSTVRALASDCLWADAMLRPKVAQAIKIRSSAPMAVFLFLRSLALRGLYRRFEIGANPSGCRSRSLAIPQNRQNRIKRCGAVACRLEYLPHHDLSAAIGWAPATVRNWYARQVHKEPAYER